MSKGVASWDAKTDAAFSTTFVIPPKSLSCCQFFKIPVKRGRAFNERDDRLGPPVVVINEAMAKQFWVNGDPLDDRLVIGRGVMREFRDEPERQIIGVVGDTKASGLNNNPQATMYIPQAQVTDAANALNVGITPMAWIVRTKVPAASMTGPVQEQLRQATGLAVSDVETMNRVVSTSISRQRFNMLLMTVFAGAALLLAAIGIYGLMAYSVEQRTLSGRYSQARAKLQDRGAIARPLSRPRPPRLVKPPFERAIEAQDGQARVTATGDFLDEPLQ